ncbi:MAG: hypothetical protein ACYTDT_07290, partial [Planctomycetota bacterium]
MDFLAAAIDPSNIQHHLTIITFLPLLGALMIAFVNKERAREIKALAIFFSIITFVASLPILFGFASNSNFQMIEHS